MSELKIPICSFGKKLDIKHIIEKVEYVKGNKNDIGDSEDDYVKITLKDTEVME